MDVKNNRLGRFEIFRDSAREFRWRFRASNQKIVAVSEGYVAKQGAERGVLAVVRAMYGVAGKLSAPMKDDNGLVHKDVVVEPPSSSVAIAIGVSYPE